MIYNIMADVTSPPEGPKHWYDWPRASKFSERQSHDLRRQGQPDSSWMNDKPLFCFFAEVFLKGSNPTCHRRARCRGKLYFNRDQFAASFDNQINFHSSRGAPEVDLRLFAPVDERLHDFEKNGGFKDCPAQRTRYRVIWIFQTSQVAKRTGVREVHLRRLDQAFADVGMVRPQHDDLEGRLKHGEPRFSRVHRDTKVVRNVGEIEQLAGPGRECAQETLERDQVPNLAERSDVALQVGLNVAGMPQRDVAIGVSDKFRIFAAQEAPPKIRRRKVVDGRVLFR